MPKVTVIIDHDTEISKVFARQDASRMLVNWLDLEQSLRQVLGDFDAGRLSMLHTLKFIDGYLGAYTLRGCELNGGEEW